MEMVRLPGTENQQLLRHPQKDRQEDRSQQRRQRRETVDIQVVEQVAAARQGRVGEA